MAARDQQRLHFAAFGARDAGVVGGPGRGERRAAAQPVRQMRDRQAVALGRVVAVDRIEVAQHQEGRPLRARGREQAGGTRARGQGRAVDAGHAALGPVAHRALGAAAFAAGVEVARQFHLEAPGLGRLPTRLDQEVRGRGQRIGRAVHQVGFAIPIEVHCEALESAGHELRVAERAGPGTHEALGRDVARLQDAHRGKQLGAKVTLSAAEAGQCAQRLHQWRFAQRLTEVALHTPHRDHRGRVHAITFLHALERVGVKREHGLALGHALLVHEAGEVVPDGGAELGLVVELVDHGHVGLKPLREAREGDFAHAHRAGRRAQAGQAILEFTRRWGRGGGRRGLCPGRCGEQCSDQGQGVALCIHLSDLSHARRWSAWVRVATGNSMHTGRGQFACANALRCRAEVLSFRGACIHFLPFQSGARMKLHGWRACPHPNLPPAGEGAMHFAVARTFLLSGARASIPTFLRRGKGQCTSLSREHLFCPACVPPFPPLLGEG